MGAGADIFAHRRSRFGRDHEKAEAMSAEARVKELGLEIPHAPAAVAAYVPTLVAGGFIYVSGQLPMRDGGLPRTGSVGADLSVEQAQEEARFCALNLLAQLRAAAGSLDRIE